MIYLQTGILILEVFLCLLLNKLLKNKLNKKNTIPYLYRITIKLLEYAYVSSYVGCTLFCLLVLVIVFKKENQSSAYFFQLSYPHRHFWLCEYVYDPQDDLQHHNHKRNHKYIIKSKTKFLSTWQRLRL